MSSIFTKICQREIPGHFVAENEEFFAILDINPLKIGHTLVIPKIEVDYLFDLDDDVLARYFAFSKRVAKAIEKNVSCKRIGVAVIGLEVPHAHVHLVPINGIEDINFSAPKLSLSQNELAELAQKIGRSFNESDQGFS
ncbi:MAG: HIT family protein [Salibacteraceae bacterium]